MAIEINNNDLFGKVIAEALAKVENNGSLTSGLKIRWINAIGAAAALIEDQPEWLEFHPDLNMLTVWNQKTNMVYNANGVCECLASQRGFPCKHRAAKQLIKHYFEALETTPPTTAGAAVEVPMEKSPYFQKTTATAKPMRVGAIRI